MSASSTMPQQPMTAGYQAFTMYYSEQVPVVDNQRYKNRFQLMNLVAGIYVAGGVIVTAVLMGVQYYRYPIQTPMVTIDIIMAILFFLLSFQPIFLLQSCQGYSKNLLKYFYMYASALVAIGIVRNFIQIAGFWTENRSEVNQTYFAFTSNPHVNVSIIFGAGMFMHLICVSYAHTQFSVIRKKVDEQPIQRNGLSGYLCFLGLVLAWNIIVLALQVRFYLG
jgi:hypothetical protein